MNRVRLIRAHLHSAVASAEVAGVITALGLMLDPALAIELINDREGRQQLEAGVVAKLQNAIVNLQTALGALGVDNG